MKHRIVMLAAAAAVVLSGTLLLRAERAYVGDERQFTHLFVVVSTREAPDVQTVLFRPQVRHMGHHSFLVGRARESRNPQAPRHGWREDRPVWIAMEEITQMVEFASFDDYERAGTASQP